MSTKKCSKCGVVKELSEFEQRKDSKDGLRGTCRECSSLRHKEYYILHKQEALLRAEKYVVQNKDKVSGYQKQYRLDNKDKSKQYFRERQLNNRKEIAEYKKQWQHTAANTEQWIDKIPVPDNPLFENEKVTVECKNCHKRFAPTKQMILDRVRAWEGKESGERNFYCSDECKHVCPLYKFSPARHTDPKSKLYVPKTTQQEARACQTRTLKEMQCDEKGYNFCERCGDIIDVELHHTLPVAQFGKEAINPAGHMLLCAGCHVELHKECR